MDLVFSTFLLTFTALFSIVNPLSGAFIFFGATRELDTKLRASTARWVAIYAFIIVAAAGWRMLNAPDATEQRRNETPEPKSIDVAPSRLAFYPLTMPLTTGPGTISVAISLGAGRPSGFHASSLAFFVETLAATALLSVLIYGFYRNSARLAKWIGATGTTIVVRLSAFLLFCIGIQVAWNGAAELLSTLPFNPVS